MTKEEMESVNADYIEGDKAGSRWLVTDNVHILHKYGTESKSEIFWECADRRRHNCRFKAATVNDDNDTPVLTFSYKLDVHTCNQTKVGPIMQKFRTKIKKRMQLEYKNAAKRNMSSAVCLPAMCKSFFLRSSSCMMHYA